MQAAIDRGLDGIAITDHNTAAFIDEIQKAAKGRKIVIFPGVEISTEAGYHLIALFDPRVDQKHIESFLGAINITPQMYGRSDTYSKTSTHDIIAKIHERSGLAILAHIDLPKGAYYEQIENLTDGKIKVPITCSGFFNEALYDAVESANGVLPAGYDAQHQFKRFPPVYQASDNPDPAQPTKHSAEGLASRHSWFKLDQIDIEGLRQCFSDPEVRIKLMGYHNDVGYPKIIGMRIGGAGFLSNQYFEFHEGLNCLIGGKGVGKSLAIEMLRFVLDQVPTSDSNLLEDHIKKLEKRLEAGNSVELVYQVADGTQYRLTRIFEGRSGGARSLRCQSTLRCINLATGDEFSGDITRLFPVLAYSQTEVIKIAEDKNAQLQLMDRFIDTRPTEAEITDVLTKLHDNDDSLKPSYPGAWTFRELSA